MTDHESPVSCWVYRTSRKADTYIYLAREDDFDLLPPALRTAVGELHLVISLELTRERALANADVERVMSDLGSSGFYLQLPPTDMPFEGPSESHH